MTKEEKVKYAIQLVSAIVGGYSSQANIMPKGLTDKSWEELFENCYKGLDIMIEKANEINPPGNPTVAIL